MRRAVLDFAVWVLVTLLLWQLAELGLRPSAVLSLLLAAIFDQILLVQLEQFEPKESRGVFSLVFKPEFGRVLLDLGIIDSSTSDIDVDVLHKETSGVPKFPIGDFWCTWIPDANLYVWPHRQTYQSQFGLRVLIKVPPGCPFSKTWEAEERLWGVDNHCEIWFFIGPHEYGLDYVPKKFVDARRERGGLGDACLEAREISEGAYSLVVGRMPNHLVLFRPLWRWKSMSDYSTARRNRYRKALERRKALFAEDGWTLELEAEEYTQGKLEIARHKYMTIEIDNRPA